MSYFRADAQCMLDDGSLKLFCGCLACYNGVAWSFDLNDIKRTISARHLDYKESSILEVLSFAKLLATDPMNVKKYTMKDNPYLIAFRNGVLNINTKELCPSSKELPCCCAIDCNWNPEADGSTILTFLHEITTNNPEKQMALLELVGSILFRRRMFQVMWILYGKGSNGKSVFLSLIQYMLGQSNISNVSIRQLSGRFGASCIRNRLLNVNADIESEKIDASGQSILKNVASGDLIATEAKGKDLESSFAVYPMLVFSCNFLPVMDDRSDGFSRRLRIVPFTAHFSPGGKNYNPNITDSLCTDNNASALAYMAIQALNYCLTSGSIDETEEMVAAKNDYLITCKPMLSFIRDLPSIITTQWDRWRKAFIREISSPPEDAKVIVLSLSTKNLYMIYRTWCEEEGWLAIKSAKFTNEIKDYYSLEVRQTTNKSGDRIRVFYE